ncbi:FHA domain-containing protein [Cellulomonas soli]|uniref:FHA domain-containing protein n=1 Tax=Cellulomonas soli TaxID=931535 RepID=UPI003F827AAB
MIVPEYVPGRWTAVVAGGTLALVGPHARPATVRALWDEAPARSGLVGLLGVLVREGFDGLPPFALVALDGDRVHAALRGEVEVVVECAQGPVVLRAGDVSTWTEQVVEGARALTVRAGSQVPDAVALPLVEGVVRADVVTLTLVANAEPSTAGRRAPVREPERGALGAGLPVDDLPVDAPGGPAGDPAPLGDGFVEDAPVQEPPAQDVWPAPALSLDEVPLSAPVSPAPEPEPLAPTPHPQGSATAPGRMRTRPGVVEAAEALLLEDVPVAPSSPDDHDGLTIMSSDLAAIRDQLPSWASDSLPSPFGAPGAVGAQVPIITGALPTVGAPAGPEYRLVLSTGLVVSLDRAVLLGRAPQVSRVANRELPRLVTVPSPQQDISRTHAEVRVESGDVLVTDLGSTNGVQVLDEHGQTRRLHPGEPSRVAVGETVDLGDGVTFTVERGS